ncbi:hypothetical protein [Pseudoflavonifractor hominis]|uniref:Uncharacterized protein n=1 Tax=Pseudoflavonifractor hominis TaxID=2763059 RepID=A0ABR7HS56_9FIRM|nr:hypothetical protein [Pseudoflavonifractor hominis]MBC5730276.1 hypothetical protein [Pseudoflavonifractor hominis]
MIDYLVVMILVAIVQLRRASFIESIPWIATFPSEKPRSFFNIEQMSFF